MPYQCQIQPAPFTHALALRARTSVDKLPQFFGHAFDAVMQRLGALGEQPIGAPYAAYYNMDMQNLDVEGGFPVARELAGEGEVQPSRFHGEQAAVCMHAGPYDQMAAAYEALTQFVAAQGRETTGVVYEVYLTDPSVTPPAEMQTLIVFPLK